MGPYMISYNFYSNTHVKNSLMIWLISIYYVHTLHQMVLIQRHTVRSTKAACQNILKGSIRKDIKQIICYRSGTVYKWEI